MTLTERTGQGWSQLNLLDRQSASAPGRPGLAVLWNGLGVGGRHVVQFAATMVLARALSPQDFGAVGMIVVLTAFAAVFADLGLGVALVQHSDLTKRQLDAAFWLTTGVGALLTAAMWAAAPAVAAFYDQPFLAPLTRATALQFVLNSVGTVPRALLVRGVQFRALALIELCTGIAASGGGIVLALSGGGVWALVGQLLIGAGVGATLCAVRARWHPCSFAGPRELTGIASFSRNLVGFRAVNYWARNADSLLIGRFLGPTSLGLYGLAYQLILLPLQQVNAIIGDVMVPVMANCKADPAQVRLAFTRAVEATALVLFPVMVGLIIVAGEAVPILFGDGWQRAVPLARILAVAGCFQTIGVTVGWIYQSQGRSDIMLRWGMFATLISVAGVAAGMTWGVAGVAVGHTIAVAVLTPLSHHFAGRIIELHARELLAALRPAVVATTWMTAVTLAVRATLIRFGQADMGVLVGTVVAGGAAYACALAVLRPASLDVLRPVNYERVQP